jgi:hypothetical protein
MDAVMTHACGREAFITTAKAVSRPLPNPHLWSVLPTIRQISRPHRPQFAHLDVREKLRFQPSEVLFYGGVLL